MVGVSVICKMKIDRELTLFETVVLLLKDKGAIEQSSVQRLNTVLKEEITHTAIHKLQKCKNIQEVSSKMDDTVKIVRGGLK